MTAYLGSRAGHRMRLPAGVLLGAVAAVAAVQLWTGQAVMPGWIKIISQGLIGTQIGTMLDQTAVKHLRRLWPEALLLLLALLLYNLLTAFLLSCTTEQSAVTIICAMAPCSIADMSLLCSELGGNTSAVAAVQTMRLFFILSAAPLMAEKTAAKEEAREKTATKKAAAKKTAVEKTAAEEMQKAAIQKQCAQPAAFTQRVLPSVGKLFGQIDQEMAVCLCIGLSASWLGYLWRVPAGCLSFSAVASGAYRIAAGKRMAQDRVNFPGGLKRLAQCLSGALVGSYMAYEDLKAVASFFIPVVFALFGYLVLDYLLAKAFSHREKITFITALFAAAPGGMSDMGILAAEFGGDIVTVAFLQQIRNIGVVLLYPPVIRMFSLWM